MPLFGPPDIAKLKAKGDAKGLIRALGHKEFSIQTAAKQALWELGGAAVEELATALSDGNTVVRRGATWVLGTIVLVHGADQVAGAADGLARALRDGDEEVRRAATYALAEIGDERAVEPLIRMLKDSDTPVRHSAAVHLGKLGDPRAAKPLVELLHDPAEWGASGASSVRPADAAQEALVKLGEASIGPVTESMRDAKWEPYEVWSSRWRLHLKILRELGQPEPDRPKRYLP